MTIAISNIQSSFWPLPRTYQPFAAQSSFLLHFSVFVSLAFLPFRFFISEILRLFRYLSFFASWLVLRSIIMSSIFYLYWMADVWSCRTSKFSISGNSSIRKFPLRLYGFWLLRAKFIPWLSMINYFPIRRFFCLPAVRNCYRSFQTMAL